MARTNRRHQTSPTTKTTDLTTCNNKLHIDDNHCKAYATQIRRSATIIGHSDIISGDSCRNRRENTEHMHVTTERGEVSKSKKPTIAKPRPLRSVDRQPSSAIITSSPAKVAETKEKRAHMRITTERGEEVSRTS
ncbi:hypothetical protein QVD17_04830 [Tagetes erecta]|uniref:Uncharacterized protein n=1 Tax=Tagetes erecta TaxID=13708 RepID=A0AAD8LKA5_TARER|nr:hypothetical protein QVD17_04830 [Tagetes erecta]